jgi:hypothetical protein
MKPPRRVRYQQRAAYLVRHPSQCSSDGDARIGPPRHWPVCVATTTTSTSSNHFSCNSSRYYSMGSTCTGVPWNRNCHRCSCRPCIFHNHILTWCPSMSTAVALSVPHPTIIRHRRREPTMATSWTTERSAPLFWTMKMRKQRRMRSSRGDRNGVTLAVTTTNNRKTPFRSILEHFG